MNNPVGSCICFSFNHNITEPSGIRCTNCSSIASNTYQTWLQISFNSMNKIGLKTIQQMNHSCRPDIRYCQKTHGRLQKQRPPHLIFFNTFGPRLNGRLFSDDIFKFNFFNKKVVFWFKMSLTCVLKGPIDNIAVLAQLMAWRQTGDKRLSEPKMAEFGGAYMRLSASVC